MPADVRLMIQSPAHNPSPTPTPIYVPGGTLMSSGRMTCVGTVTSMQVNGWMVENNVGGIRNASPGPVDASTNTWQLTFNGLTTGDYTLYVRGTALDAGVPITGSDQIRVAVSTTAPPPVKPHKDKDEDKDKDDGKDKKKKMIKKAHGRKK